MPSSPAWFKVLDPDALPEGRVTTVTIGSRSLAMTHFNGHYGALDNRCHHQGGPFGESSMSSMAAAVLDHPPVPLDLPRGERIDHLRVPGGVPLGWPTIRPILRPSAPPWASFTISST
jgi:hypothetical protein